MNVAIRMVLRVVFIDKSVQYLLTSGRACKAVETV